MQSSLKRPPLRRPTLEHASPPLTLPALTSRARVSRAPPRLLFYAGLFLFVRNRWTAGCVVYSLAVSVKMNIFLFAPGLLCLLLQATGVRGARSSPAPLTAAAARTTRTHAGFM